MKRVLVALLVAGCSSAPALHDEQPRLLVDGQPFAAAIDARASRAQAHVAVTSPGAALLFGQSLSALQVDLDLTTVPNDDPTQYDIALVAACSREEQLQVKLGTTLNTEAAPDAQPSYHQLLTDGCALTPGLMQLTGQTNISKLDQQHVEMAVIFQLANGAEKHDITVDHLNLVFP
jgi:hypothetical protein